MTPEKRAYLLYRAKIVAGTLCGIGITVAAVLTSPSPVAPLLSPIGLWATAMLALDPAVVQKDKRLAKAAGIRLKSLLDDRGPG